MSKAAHLDIPRGRRAGTRAATVAALGLTLTLGTVPSAHGFGSGPAPSTPEAPPVTTVPTSTTPTSYGDSGDTVTGPTTGTVGSCSVVSSPSYLGLACGAGSGASLTPKQILGKDPVPDCWHEPLTDAELAATGYQNSADTRWYWERCLKGVDPKTYEVDDGGIRFTIGIVALTSDQVKTLTDNQQTLVDFNDDNKQVPAPVAVTSPSTRPRVGAWVSFFNGTEDTVSASAGGVELNARVSGITVEPVGATGPDGETVSCDGTGFKADSGDTPTSVPGACWYRYEESSAGEPLVDTNGLPAYPVVITATWQVSTVVGGVATPFNSFTKTQVTSLPVTEIQSIVIN